jgi:hypothetical protein
MTFHTSTWKSPTRPGKHQLVTDTLSHQIGHKDVLENETLKSLFTGTMDKDKDKEKESNSRIYKIYEAYKQWLQKGKDPRTIGNGTYLLMDDTLYCQIQNQWGAEVDIEEPLSNAKAKEAVCTLGHLGMLTMVKALQTHFSILYVCKVVQMSYVPATHINSQTVNLQLLYSLTHHPLPFITPSLITPSLIFILHDSLLGPSS